jgi:hypothetical protein
MTPEQRQQLKSTQAAAQARNNEAFRMNPNLQIWLRQVRTAAVIRKTARNLERWKHE